jgi:hypothetical protein
MRKRRVESSPKRKNGYLIALVPTPVPNYFSRISISNNDLFKPKVILCEDYIFKDHPIALSREPYVRW